MLKSAEYVNIAPCPPPWVLYSGLKRPERFKYKFRSPLILLTNFNHHLWDKIYMYLPYLLQQASELQMSLGSRRRFSKTSLHSAEFFTLNL